MGAGSEKLANGKIALPPPISDIVGQGWLHRVSEAVTQRGCTRSSQRAPLLLLHARHSTRRLLGEWSPPAASGVMWSTVRSREGCGARW